MVIKHRNLLIVHKNERASSSRSKTYLFTPQKEEERGRGNEIFISKCGQHTAAAAAAAAQSTLQVDTSEKSFLC
jgi:hypothetical protein